MSQYQVQVCRVSLRVWDVEPHLCFKKKKNITLTLFRVQLLNIESHFIKMSPPEATAAVERF